MVDVNLKVPALEKLVDYTASGIGAVAGPILAPWKARREAEARRVDPNAILCLCGVGMAVRRRHLAFAVLASGCHYPRASVPMERTGRGGSVIPLGIGKGDEGAEDEAAGGQVAAVTTALGELPVETVRVRSQRRALRATRPHPECPIELPAPRPPVCDCQPQLRGSLCGTDGVFPAPCGLRLAGMLAHPW